MIWSSSRGQGGQWSDVVVHADGGECQCAYAHGYPLGVLSLWGDGGEYHGGQWHDDSAAGEHRAVVGRAAVDGCCYVQSSCYRDVGYLDGQQ